MQLAVGRAQAQRRVGEDRKEGDDGGQDQHRALGIVEADPDQDQRRDGDDGRDLKRHRVGEERAFDRAALGEERRERDAQDQRQREGRKRDADRHPSGAPAATPNASIAASTISDGGGSAKREISNAATAHSQNAEDGDGDERGKRVGEDAFARHAASPCLSAARIGGSVRRRLASGGSRGRASSDRAWRCRRRRGRGVGSSPRRARRGKRSRRPSA